MSTRRASRSAGILTALGVAALSGCVSVQRPPRDIAAGHVGAPDRFTELAFGPEADADEIDTGWLTSFGDPVLEALVREAWDNNPDLYTTAARFEEATASLRIAASHLSPGIDGFGGARYTRYHDATNDRDEYQAGIRVSWEVDLWGRLRSDRAAALSVAAAAGLDLVQARHSLGAAVAEAYFAVVTAKQQLAIDRLLLDAERFTAATTRQRVDAGIGTKLDGDLAESSVQLAHAAVQSDLAALREASRALELLVGRYPSAELDAAPETLPAVPAGPVAAGVPSALLERRPDVRSAERLVDAAYYNVRSARAAKLPGLTLSADATTLIDPSDFITSVAADILAPLFEGGRLRAEEAAADARQRQAIGRFASVALRAFREVESALSNARHLAEREASIAAASDRLQLASDAASSRYEQGLLTILDLQQVRRRDYETRSLLLSVRFEQIRERLRLHLALGGPVLEPDSAGHGTDGAAQPADGRFADPPEAPKAGELRVGAGRSVESEAGAHSENSDGR